MTSLSNPARRRTTWLLAAAAFVLAILLAEGAFRVAGIRPGFQARHPEHPRGLLIPHPTRGYTIAPGFSRVIQKPTGPITMYTDDLGLRYDGTPRVKGGRTFLAVGNSFTVGWGIDVQETWPGRLQHWLAARGHTISVLNGGVWAYNMAQIRDRASELVELLHPEVVIAAVYGRARYRMADPYWNLDGILRFGSGAEKSRLTKGGYYFSPMYRRWMIETDFWLDEHFRLGALAWKASYAAYASLGSHESQEALGEPAPTRAVADDPNMALLLDEVERLHRETAAAGVPLVVMLVNPQEEDGSFLASEHDFNTLLREFCGLRGIPVVGPLERFEREAGAGDHSRFRLGSDHHWSPFANDLAAQAVAATLDSLGLLGRRRTSDRPAR